MERIVHLEDVDPRVLYGEHNSLIRQLESYVPKLKIVARGEVVKFTGSPEDVAMFEEKLDLILRHIRKFNVLTSPQLERIVLDDSPSILKSLSEGDEVIVHGVNGHVIKARTANQQRMVNAVGTNDLTFAMGPAGTGKTYTAVALAVRALKNKEVRRLVLTRPAVEAGESLGFLPGDMKEKLDPYMQPLYDALRDMIPAERLVQYLENGTIEIAPLAFMRGRTLDRAFVILDEAQNTTVSQMKMFLTRMGPSSKFIVTGDPSQTDLPPRAASGLPHALRLLGGMKGIGHIELDGRDVVRHPLVRKIIAAYDAEGQKSMAARTAREPDNQLPKT
jgi:phosphate starvation-inducible PhoH-like protein